jgi:hypothetical protein
LYRFIAGARDRFGDHAAADAELQADRARDRVLAWADDQLATRVQRWRSAAGWCCPDACDAASRGADRPRAACTADARGSRDRHDHRAGRTRRAAASTRCGVRRKAEYVAILRKRLRDGLGRSNPLLHCLRGFACCCGMAASSD